MKLFVTIFLFLASAFPTMGQSDCDCRLVVEELTSRIETDYVAYFVEVKGRKDAEYLQHKDKFRRQAEKTPIDKCVPLMQGFVRYFRDGHLFVSQTPKITDEQANQRKQFAEKINRSESELRQYFENSSNSLDPIEGIWFASNQSRYAIFRDKKSAKRDFVAILISEGKGSWETGQVKAEFKKLKDGSYDATYYDGKHFPLYPTLYKSDELGGADIRRELILGMPPFTWGKELPLSKEPYNIIDKTDARRPTLQIIDAENILISIPSHSPEYAPVLKELVERNKDQISRAENLILDLRGNHGGSTGTTNILMPFIESTEKYPDRYWVGDDQFIVASKQNSNYYKQGVSQGWLPKDLMTRIDQSLGNLIPLTVSKGEPFRLPVKELERPKNVAILMDKGISSAGEAFIIQAMKSKKVTLFGDNTAGMIDYQSVSIVAFSRCSDQGFYLGYPMFAASNRLPTGGVNSTGILPNVRIKAGTKSPIEFIINYYTNRIKRTP